jgi:membrane-associated progesterone receptor component
VAIKGTVFDVSRNEAYAPKGTYHGIDFLPLGSLSRTFPITFCCRHVDWNGIYLTAVRAVFAGKDPSRALATSSLKPEDCVPEWSDLKDENKTVLSEWYTFFSKRYNIVGKVQGATNL